MCHRPTDVYIAAPGIASGRATGPSVVVISHNSARWLPRCLEILLASVGSSVAVQVVDSGSVDGSSSIASAFLPSASVITSAANLGFAGAANLGLRACGSDTAVILNPDVEINEATVRQLTRALADDPALAIVGCKLLYPGGRTVQHAGGSITYPQALPDHYGYQKQDDGQYDDAREVDYVTGALFAVKTSAIKEVGYFDEGFYPAYFEEVDLCYRARRAGFKVLYVPSAVAIHHESVTTGKETAAYYRFFHRNRIRFVLKHYSDEQLWRDFLPCESAWLRRVGPGVELEALRGAYSDNLAVLEGRADFLVNPLAAVDLPRGQHRGEMLRILSSVVGDIFRSNNSAGGELLNRIADLSAKSSLIEPSFVSNVPSVGPWIARIRRSWNWMSTKWYVKPIVKQQTEFNALTVEILREMARTLGSMPTRLAENVDASADLHQVQINIEARSQEAERHQTEIERRLGHGVSRSTDTEEQEG